MLPPSTRAGFYSNFSVAVKIGVLGGNVSVGMYICVVARLRKKAFTIGRGTTEVNYGEPALDATKKYHKEPCFFKSWAATTVSDEQKLKR